MYSYTFILFQSLQIIAGDPKAQFQTMEDQNQQEQHQEEVPAGIAVHEEKEHPLSEEDQQEQPIATTGNNGGQLKKRILWKKEDIVEERTERTIVFADAVIAIALTLLILPLMENADEEKESVGEWYHENRFKIGAFIVTFFLIWKFWQAHADAYLIIKRMTRLMNIFHSFWLLTIVFMPVAVTAVFNLAGTASPEEWQEASFSLGIATVISKTFWILVMVTARLAPQSWRKDIKDAKFIVTECLVESIITWIFLGIACGLCFVGNIGPFGLLLVWLSKPIIHIIEYFGLLKHADDVYDDKNQ